jgi:aspartyl-tRNA(Asn)/glutamyl-tRNA(Gln) amidotransferase subunit C
MAKLSKKDVLKLARLARIELEPDEINVYIDEINRILTYVEQLKLVDSKDVIPTNQITGLTNIMRSDVIIDYGYNPRSLFKNVPKVRQHQIQVKRMVEL